VVLPERWGGGEVTATTSLTDANHQPDESMTDWHEWSRQAVAEMQARNRAWIERFSLERAPYHWDLDSAVLTFQRAGDCVTADLCVIGTAFSAQRIFRWAWADETIPTVARRGLDLVRAFGEKHDLPLLITPEWSGGRAEGLEMVAVAGRIQGASGAFVDQAVDLTLFFTLSNFRVAPRAGADDSPAG